jgi:uncharacterized protein
VTSPTSPTIRDNPVRNRYEIHEGEQLVGFTRYRLGDGQISFLHTEVAPEFGGRGLARQLVTEELEDARRRGLAVLPYCPYVAKVIAQNLDAYLDLVPEAERHGFRLPRTADGTGRPGTRTVNE